MIDTTPQPTKGSILLIEDNLFMAELLAEKLRHQEFATVRAHDGQEGLSMINSGLPSLVLLDLPLAGDVDGIEVLRRIRAEYDQKKLPVLVLFNRVDEKTIKAVVDLKANSYLIKADTNTGGIIDQIKKVAERPDVFIEPPRAEVLTPVAESATAGEKVKKEERPITFEGPPQLHQKIEEILKLPEPEVSIIQLVDSMLEFAFLSRASDIHLEPVEVGLISRFRVDGILHDAFTIPKTLHSGVITRIKVLGAMRTDEHQAAQDGRFKIAIKEPEREFDVRISIIPTYYGENAVLRLLAEQTTIKSIDDLALTPADKVKIRNAISKPYGMVLATGPTGSGKTTTLYTILKEVNTRETQIITIEDPIEYSLEGVDQIQVNSRTGLTFAAGLRSILRQDPNVIMVGEIRDEETASIAVNAALTGHKLLSTLHTNDSATTLPRLLDMGVEPFLVASTVNIAIGQRLVRMLCQKCKTAKRITDAEFENLAEHLPPEMISDHRDYFYGAGCDACGGSGYYNRMGIYEILEMNDFIREAIMRHADAGEIKKIAIKNGMTTLLEDGFSKALKGETTIEEILRVVRE